MRRLLLLAAILLLAGCTSSRYEVPGKPGENITIQRFDRVFYEQGTWKDSAFLDLYANQIMEIGDPGSKNFQTFQKLFSRDQDMHKLYNDCQETFEDVSDIESQLSWAFHRLQYFFPNIPLPKVYMHISGYGSSVVAASGILSADIDKYLGQDYDPYKNLFSPYQTQNMRPDKLVADYVSTWVRAELPEYKLMSSKRLIDYVVYEGKLLFLLEILLPEESMENLSGFRVEQMEWCISNEAAIWKHLSQPAIANTTDGQHIASYIREAPNTEALGKKSPGRAAIWSGYKLVEKYMEKNPKVTVQDLLLKTSTDDILRNAEYPD